VHALGRSRRGEEQHDLLHRVQRMRALPACGVESVGLERAAVEEKDVASAGVGVMGDLGLEEDALASVGVDDGAHLAGDGVFYVHEHLDLREAEEVRTQSKEREEVVPVLPACAPAGGYCRGYAQASLWQRTRAARPSLTWCESA
jgi:hypothetical protein